MARKSWIVSESARPLGMMETVPRARSSMSLLGRTVAVPWASRSSTSSPDSRTTKPSNVRPSPVAIFWGSKPSAILGCWA